MNVFIGALLSLVSVVTLSGLNTPKVNPQDLDSLTGPQWTGSLTYLDYKSRKKVSIPSNLTVTKSAEEKNTWVFDYSYPKEPNANGKKAFVVSTDGSMMNDERIAERTTLPDNTLKIVTEKQGEDNNRKALFRSTYLISAKKFSIKKEVRYENEPEFFERNEYSWQR